MSWKLQRDGFCMLEGAITSTAVAELITEFSNVLGRDSHGVLLRSDQGHAVAARNLIDSVPLVRTVWQSEGLIRYLKQELGQDFGLVRALFFDKPPDRTWALAWHKDTAIAVKDNSLSSASFSRPTVKAGVPHVVACDSILRRMLTLRIHFDQVTDENGPLEVVPGSHTSSTAIGVGTDAAVPIHAQPGDVLAMRPMITHGSGASQAGTMRHRRILHLEFSADAILPDGFSWYRFVAPNLHSCEPVAS